MTTTDEINCKCGHNLMRHNKFISEGVFGCVECDCQKMQIPNKLEIFEAQTSNFENHLYTLWKKRDVMGCVMEDGADTRTYSQVFFLVTESEEDNFAEFIADECGNQDYSYEVSFKKLGVFTAEELLELQSLIENEKKRQSR